ncbi:NADP-dependent phosphogluconate dehydrogenase [Aerococcus urinae]
MQAEVGVIGLGVMGYGFAMNLLDYDYRVAIVNWEKEVTQKVSRENEDKPLIATYSLEEFVTKLERPRKIIMMVKAGQATDNTINHLLPLLNEGDVLVNGGNTYFRETEATEEKVKTYGIHYIGMGVSGGEEGARYGAALMPGGSQRGYELCQMQLEALAAKAPQDGEPCVAYMGEGGAGHFTKMIHNGIEYSDSQLIAEAYWLLRYYLKLPVNEIADLFREWDKGELKSYLIGITANILDQYDEDGSPMIDVILDAARSKGTGKWASQTALDMGQPLTVVTEAVFMRYVSELKQQRLKAANILSGPQVQFDGDKGKYIEKIRQTLYFAKIISYAQGFSAYQQADESYGYALNPKEIAKIFRAGCVIQAELLDKIAHAYERTSNLENILLDDYFASVTNEYQTAIRQVVSDAIMNGFSVNAMASAIGYFDSYRNENVSANMVQAQRDYFGAHTYQRRDKEGNYHYHWDEAREERLS